MAETFGERLPIDGSKVEVYSASLATWIPATVTAIVDERDVVVQYAVGGARQGASGVRTKRVDVFDPDLMRSIQTGRPFAWQVGGLLGPDGGSARAPVVGPAAASVAPSHTEPDLASAPATPSGPGETRFPQEGGTVEVYSNSLQTWIPATVTGVVDDQDIVVHYAVTGAREGASGFRTKRVDVFDAALVRSLQTGQHFEKREPSPSDVDVGFDALASEATLS
jgi:hypothetical protein